MGIFFSMFSKPKREFSKTEIPLHNESKLYGSTSAKITPKARMDPTTKRKRAAGGDEREAPPKAARRHSPIPLFDPADSNGTKPKSSFKRKQRSANAFESEEATPSSTLKRKRSSDDEEPDPLSKAARTRSYVSSDTNDTDDDIPLAKLKRKRLLDDEEHGSLSKTSRTRSPTPSYDTDDTDENSPLEKLKRKRFMDDEEHGALAKAARTYSPIPSSDTDDTNDDIQLATLKRKRLLDDDEHGSLSKAARTYSPTPSSESDAPPPSSLKRALSYDSDDEAAPSRKKTRYNERIRSSTTRSESAASSPDLPRLPNKRKRTTTCGFLNSDSEDQSEDAEISNKRPRHIGPIQQNTSRIVPTPTTKPKRVLPWVEPDYPYYTKRPRVEIPEDENYPAQRTQKYDGLRYYRTNENSTVQWEKFGVLIGELTHLTVPKPTPAPEKSNNPKANPVRPTTLPPPHPSLPPRPPPPAPIPHLTKKHQHIIARAKAKREAKKASKKASKVPPKLRITREVKERYKVYAKFNHNMRFSLKVVPEVTITSTEFRRTYPEKGKENPTKGNTTKENPAKENRKKENPTKGKIPAVTQTTKQKVHYEKQSKLALEQFDIYLELGRMVWEEGWKDVFVKGRDKGDGVRSREDVGEGLQEMPGLLAVMRRVMECPPPDATVARRIRSFHATGKFDGSVRGI